MLHIFSLPSKIQLSQLSYIKASPLIQTVTASPKGDLNTGVLLYLGDRVTKDGLQSVPEKVKTISEMPQPTNVTT